MTRLVAPGVEREVARDAPVEEAVAGLVELAHGLFRAGARPAENTVMSPLSVAYAFAIARAGARGETARQLDETLRFPGEGTHPAYNALTRRIVATGAAPPVRQPGVTRGPGSPQPPTVSIANGLFAQRGTAVEEAFLRILASHYGADVEVLDFGSADAVRTVNDWVREQTAERVDRLYDRLDPQSRLVIANAIYLKADWATPFAAHATGPGRFTRADGSAVTAPMMWRLGAIRFAAGPSWQAVELSYAGGELAMWVLVPGSRTSPGDLLAPETMAAVRAGLRHRQVELAMPRWDFAGELDLVSALRALGLEAPFGPAADFAGLAPDVHIDQAVHRANITVDEWGTEAAAVTGLMVTVSAPSEPDVTVRADHPFAFAVMHLPTGAPLFVGQVAEPATG